MKIAIDLEGLGEKKPAKEKLIAFRVTKSDYAVLKSYNDNVSATIRALVEQFVEELEKEKHSWTRR